MKDKQGKQNNQGSSKDAGSTKTRCNTGASTGLRKESGTDQGAMNAPSNKNQYPSGMS